VSLYSSSSQTNLPSPSRKAETCTPRQRRLSNEAYEVLSNPELKQRFDNGEDLTDPMAGQGDPVIIRGCEHPFAHLSGMFR
jgi:DnaJ family protein C protein 3